LEKAQLPKQYRMQILCLALMKQLDLALMGWAYEELAKGV
jgi:hypothetical protein